MKKRINRACFLKKKRRIGRRVELMRFKRCKESEKELYQEELVLQNT